MTIKLHKFNVLLDLIYGIFLFAIGILWYKKPPQNYYTKVATFELSLALMCRLLLEIVLAFV